MCVWGGVEWSDVVRVCVYMRICVCARACVYNVCLTHSPK